MPITGGAGAKFRSAIIGSLSMAILANGMSLWGVDTYYQQMVRGAIFLIVIMISFDRNNVKVIK
jgi:ribose transport system permease protein